MELRQGKTWLVLQVRSIFADCNTRHIFCASLCDSSLPSSQLWRSLFVYLDDIQVFEQTLPRHLRRLDLALQRLAKADLKIKLSKREFGHRELTFLGFRTNKNGLRAGPAKIAAIVDCRPPANVPLLQP